MNPILIVAALVAAATARPWSDDMMYFAMFAFARASDDGETFVVVAMNASAQERVTAADGHQIQLPASLKAAGKFSRPVLTTGDGGVPPISNFAADGPLCLPVPASGLVVYEAEATP